MVTVSPTASQPHGRPASDHLSSEQAALIDQAMSDLEDEDRGHARALVELLRDLNLDHDCIAAALVLSLIHI